MTSRTRPSRFLRATLGTGSGLETRLVTSSVDSNHNYEVNTKNWTCTCTVGRTGYPSGEPCKHQHSVATIYNLTASNLIPYFNGEGRYLHALIAVGHQKVGHKSFYAS